MGRTHTFVVLAQYMIGTAAMLLKRRCFDYTNAAANKLLLTMDALHEVLALLWSGTDRMFRSGPAFGGNVRLLLLA